MTAAEQTAEQRLTHHVALILDNDEPLYLHQRELTSAAIHRAEHHFAAIEEPRRSNVSASVLADDLKDWCEELCGLEDDALPALTRELVQTALHHVDWIALAKDFLERLAEES